MEPIGGFGSGGYRMGAFRTLQPALAAKLVDKACRNSEILLVHLWTRVSTIDELPKAITSVR